MNWAEFIIDLIVDSSKAISWPVVVLILVVIYRKALRGLIERMKQVKLPGCEFNVNELGTSQEKVAGTRPQAGAQLEIRSVNPEGATNKDPRRLNYYWLGHDLMWTQDAVYHGATRDYVLHGLQSALAHLRVAGLANQFFEDRLKSLMERVSMMLERDLTPEQRSLVGAEVRTLKMELGRCIQMENEP